MAEVSNRFKAILNTCSAFIFFHCRKKLRQRKPASQTTSRAAFHNRAKSCSLWSFFRLTQCTRTHFEPLALISCGRIQLIAACSRFNAPWFSVSVPNPFLIQGLITMSPLAPFAFCWFQLLQEMRWWDVDGSFILGKMSKNSAEHLSTGIILELAKSTRLPFQYGIGLQVKSYRVLCE